MQKLLHLRFQIQKPMSATPLPKMPRSLSHLLAPLLVIIAGPLQASIPINQLSFSYSQNFDTPDFATEVATAGTGAPITWSWSNHSTYSGWTRQMVINSVNTTNKDHIGEFSSNTIRFGNMGNGGTFNTVSSPTTDRALGLLMEGIVGAGNAASLGVVFQVGAGLQVTGATVGFNGEQWFRAAATANDRLDFQYKILSSYDPATFRIHTESGWTDVDSLDFPVLKTGINQKLDGNAATNRSALSSAISLNATAGQFIAFHWTNTSDSTATQAALAVDDLSHHLCQSPARRGLGDRLLREMAPRRAGGAPRLHPPAFVPRPRELL